MRAAIYCRVSSQGQEDNSSLDTQEADCRAYAAEQGWTVPEAHVYREVFSGAFLDRPKLTRLREAIDRRELDRVIVWHTDRFGRDANNAVYLQVEAKRRGVTYVSVKNPMDETPMGQMVNCIVGIWASMEREGIRLRTGEGIRKRVASGKCLPGSKPRYGYQWAGPDKGSFVEDPITAPVVQRIFREAAEGVPLRRIAENLIRDRIPTPKNVTAVDGTPNWRHGGVYDILTSPVYNGLSLAYVHEAVPPRTGGPRKTSLRTRPEAEWVVLPDGNVPPLVDAATWDRVQSRLALNRATSARNAKPTRNGLLRHCLVRCGHCGAAMGLAKSKGRAERYRCPASKRDPACGKNGHTIDTATLDAAVWAFAMALIEDLGLLVQDLARLAPSDPDERSVEALDRELTAVAREVRNINAAIRALDDPTSPALKSLVDSLRSLADRRKFLQGQQAELLGRHAAKAAWANALDVAMDWNTQLREWAFSEPDGAAGVIGPDRQREVILRLGLRVKVYREGTGFDRWTFSVDPPSDAVAALSMVLDAMGEMEGPLERTPDPTEGQRDLLWDIFDSGGQGAITPPTGSVHPPTVSTAPSR